jgi:hypothetical protein
MSDAWTTKSDTHSLVWDLLLAMRTNASVVAQVLFTADVDNNWTLESTAAHATVGGNTTIVNDMFEDWVKFLRLLNHHSNESTTVPMKSMGQFVSAF